MVSYKTIEDFDLHGKVVLMRADLNVPVNNGEVTDTTRIDRLKETIEYLSSHGAKTLILSHFGRPNGERNMDYSLSFLAPVLSRQWDTSVNFIGDCVGEVVFNSIHAMKVGDFSLLENVRFYPGEEANDLSFAKRLAEHADIYVNDAFSVSHRAHASTEGLAHVLPTAAGFLMGAELKALKESLEDPERPVLAIVGGAKISTKLSVLNNIVKRSNYMVLGGGMANTFMYAQGTSIGNSLCEKDMKDEALKIMDTALEHNCQIILPEDIVVISGELYKDAPHETVIREQIQDNHSSVDAGPKSTAQIQKILKKCKTVLWNGPLGVFELTPFDKATNDVARSVAELTKAGKIVSVAGGGDTVAALENAGVTQDFSYISTAGGAFLEWLEGKTLPGVAALSAKQDAA